MKQFIEINYENISINKEYEELLENVTRTCFETENIEKTDLYLSVTLSDEDYIQNINRKFRNIDKPTDVLSFPMFEKDEIPKKSIGIPDVLGDIIVCIPIVEKQALEYGHSFKRELSYMLVHGFYHLMGFDHIKEEDKTIMRKKEEDVLSKLKIIT